jgi:hypothetical protein
LFEPVGKLTAVVVPYGTGLSLAYLIGYWSPFGVNPLEYVGLSDIFRLALRPMLYSLAGIVVGFALSHIGPAIAIPPGGGADTRFGRWFNRNKTFIAATYAGAVVLAFQFLLPKEDRWLALGFLLMPFALALETLQIVREVVPQHGLRSFLLALVVVLPPVAYWHGGQAAREIRAGKAEYAIDAARLPRELELRSTRRNPILYVGRLGNHFAIYETLSRQLVLVPVEKIPVLAIREK